MQLRIFCVSFLVLGACGNVKDKPPIDSAEGSDSAIDSPPITACPVGVTSLCDSGNLVTCDGQGVITETTPCALGCNATDLRCNKVDPSNGLAAALDDAAGAADLTLVGDATIDTDTGAITDTTGAKTPITQTLSTGLPIGVFVIKAKTITAAKITVTGTKALALVADGAITLNGRVAVDARLDVPGPGSITTDATCRGGTALAGTDGNPGGGGGAFGTTGGKGGSGGGVAGPNGGAVVGNVDLVPLRGGCSGGHPGGRGFDVDPGVGDPGGGGGAIQVVSNTSITFGPSASITVNGAGGKANTGQFFLACLVNTPCGDGEGGGSGGGILLEAPSITMDATGGLFANGGGGACDVNGSAAAGTLSLTPAAGHNCGGGDTGNGGNGAAGAIAATNGGNGLNDDPVGGGGGGGAGRIRVNLPNGTQFQPAGTVSPTSSVGVLQTR